MTKVFLDNDEWDDFPTKNKKKRVTIKHLEDSLLSLKKEEIFVLKHIESIEKGNPTNGPLWRKRLKDLHEEYHTIKDQIEKLKEKNDRN